MVRQNNALNAESEIYRELVPCLIDGDAWVIDLGNGNSKVTVENGQGVEISRTTWELTTPLYDPDFGRGRTKFESMQDLKKRGSNSRDLADALVPTSASGFDPRPTSFEGDWPGPASGRTTRLWA